MSRRALFLACLLCVPAAAPAQTAAGTPAEAHELYQKGRFEEAAAIYEALAAAEPLEASHHYNLGNARYKTGQLGRATACYLRAFKLAPRDPDIRFNLAFALERAGEALVLPGIPEALHRLVYLLSGEELQGIFWSSWAAFFLLWGLYLLDSRLRLPTALVLAALIAAGSGGWLALRGSLEPPELAVVTLPNAEVRSGPGRNFSASYTLPEGRRVEVLGASGDWVEIGVARDGIKGWIRRDSIERV